MSRIRLNIFIEPDHARRLADIAAHKGVSKSSVIAAALSAFLSSDQAQQRETVVLRRLDRLSRQFDRLERDQAILVETVALHVRHFLTVSLPVPEEQQDAARAQGRARYAQFVEQLARQLQRGRTLARELREEAWPAPEDEALSAEESDPSAGAPLEASDGPHA